MIRIMTLLFSTFLYSAGPATPAQTSELETWPPSDPHQATANVAITTSLALRLRDIRNFDALQKAVGAKGQILSIETGGEAPHAVYGWTGAGGRGQMRVFLYRSGDFGAIVTPADGSSDIKINNFNAFVCPGCSPPVNSCGRRPSWVSHAVHWNEYDCGCTLTGPQTLRPGPC